MKNIFREICEHFVDAERVGGSHTAALRHNGLMVPQISPGVFFYHQPDGHRMMIHHMNKGRRKWINVELALLV